MTTHGDWASESDAPSAALSSNSASLTLAFIQFLERALQKKTRKDDPGGFVDNVRSLLLAGTVAIRTHVPLARHVFYVFFHIGQADKLALHVDVRKIHRRSKTDLTL